MIFGSVRDVGTLLHIGRELVQDIVEQEILLYKVNLEETLDNIYGEATHKVYWTPIKLNCLIKRGEQDWNSQDYGVDVNRSTDFAFYKEISEMQKLSLNLVTLLSGVKIILR